MRKTILVCISFILLVLWVLWPQQRVAQPIAYPTVTPEASPLPTATPTVVHLNPQLIFQLVNQERVRQGGNALVWNIGICPLAIQRLGEVHTDWSHDHFLRDFQEQVYYSPELEFGENLARYQVSEYEVVSEWAHSPEHEYNITRPGYVSTCIVTDTVGYQTYTVQEFSGN